MLDGPGNHSMSCSAEQYMPCQLLSAWPSTVCSGASRATFSGTRRAWSTGDWTWGLTHAKLVLFHLSSPLSPQNIFIPPFHEVGDNQASSTTFAYGSVVSINCTDCLNQNIRLDVLHQGFLTTFHLWLLSAWEMCSWPWMLRVMDRKVKHSLIIKKWIFLKFPTFSNVTPYWTPIPKLKQIGFKEPILISHSNRGW